MYKFTFFWSVANLSRNTLRDHREAWVLVLLQLLTKLKIATYYKSLSPQYRDSRPDCSPPLLHSNKTQTQSTALHTMIPADWKRSKKKKIGSTLYLHGPLPFTVMVMHQHKSQQPERAKWTFSRGNSLKQNAIADFPSTRMPLTTRGAPPGALASLDKTPISQMFIEGRVRELLGGRDQYRVQMLQASSLIWSVTKGVGGAVTVQNSYIKQHFFTRVV